MQAISLHTAAVLATVFTSSLSVRTNNLSTLMSRGVVAARQEIADPPSEDEVAASEAKAREIYDRAVSVARSLKTLDLVVKSNSDADSGGNPSGAARVRMEFDLAGEFAISRLRVDIAEDGGDPENPSFTVVLNEEGAIGLDFTESVYLRAPKDNPLSVMEPCLSALPQWVLNARVGGDDEEITEAVWLGEEEMDGVMCDVIAVARVLHGSAEESADVSEGAAEDRDAEATEDSGEMEEDTGEMEEESDAEPETEEESIAVGMWEARDSAVVDADQDADASASQEEHVEDEVERQGSNTSTDESNDAILLEILAIGREDGFPHRVEVRSGDSDGSSDVLSIVTMSEVVLNAEFDEAVFLVTPPEGWQDAGEPARDQSATTQEGSTGGSKPSSKGVPQVSDTASPQGGSSGGSKGSGITAPTAPTAPKFGRDTARPATALMSKLREAAVPLLANGVSGGGVTLASLLGVVGDGALPIGLKDASGKDVSLGSLLGKVVVLDFTAAWQSKRQAAQSELKEVTTDFQGKGVVVLSVNLRDLKPEAKRTQGKDDVLDLVFTGLDLASAFGVKGVPTRIVIDAKGKVVFTDAATPGPDALRKAIDAALLVK